MVVNIRENKDKKNRIKNILHKQANIFAELYKISIDDIEYIKSNFSKNPVKNKEVNQIKSYLDKKDLEQIKNIVQNAGKWYDVETLVNQKIQELEMYVEDWFDSRDIIREEITLRNKLLNDVFFIAKYLTPKLNKNFITKKTDDKYLNEIINHYNYHLAKLKYLFYCL